MRPALGRKKGIIVIVAASGLNGRSQNVRRTEMKKKGFTLIELLVVIAIIAMLLAILMPALGKVKRMAMRIVCATNLKGMGTAQMTYGLDYDDEFTVQGGRTDSTWAPSFNKWAKSDFPWSDSSKSPAITVSSSLFLLVREADVSPASFICKNSGDKEFSTADYVDSEGMDLTEIWDFGPDPAGNAGGTPAVSYSYQQPYKDPATNKSFAASGSGNPSNAIMADRNPWGDKNLSVLDGDESQKTFEKYVARLIPDGQKWEVQMANSGSHSREGQNVLFGDGHTEFERTSAAGYENDNIYTRWASTNSSSIPAEDISIGKPVKMNMITKGYALSATDSMLVNDCELE